MSFGRPGKENGVFPWAKDLDEAREIFRRAVDAGINYFDTANVYQILHFALKIGLFLSSIKILHNVILFHTQLGILAQEVLGFCFVAQLDDQIYDDHLHIQ